MGRITLHGDPRFAVRIETKEFDLGHAQGVMLHKGNGVRRAWMIRDTDSAAFVAGILRDMANWAEKVPE